MQENDDRKTIDDSKHHEHTTQWRDIPRDATMGANKASFRAWMLNKKAFEGEVPNGLLRFLFGLLQQVSYVKPLWFQSEPG